MFIVAHRKFFFWLTGLILAAAVAAIAFWGLPLGIDFTGGSLMQVEYTEGRPDLAQVQQDISVVPLPHVSVRALGENGVSIRTRSLTPDEHDAVLATLSRAAPVTELSFTSVGPSLGSQFTNKAPPAIPPPPPPPRPAPPGGPPTRPAPSGGPPPRAAGPLSNEAPRGRGSPRAPYW